MAEGDKGSDLDWLEEELMTLQIRSDRIDPQGKHSLVGTVFTNRFYRRDGFKAFVKSVWKTKEKFTIKDIGQNLYLFSFENENDLAAVMEGGPWVFRKQWVLLLPIDKAIDREVIQINESPVWIHLGNIPPGSDRDDLLDQVGSSFGRAFGKDICKKWCRVKVLMDIRRPLRRGVRVSVANDPRKWVRFQYEALPIFCYGCGRVGHGIDECMVVSEEQRKKPEREQPYTSALRYGAEVYGSSLGPEDGLASDRQKNYVGSTEDNRDAGADRSSVATQRVGPTMEEAPETVEEQIEKGSIGKRVEVVESKSNPSPNEPITHGEIIGIPSQNLEAKELDIQRELPRDLRDMECDDRGDVIVDISNTLNMEPNKAKGGPM